MTPNDLDLYLQVFVRHQVGSAALKLPDGAELHVVFVPQLPPDTAADPVPGGWKTLHHLDNPADLRDDREYRGELPS